MPVSLHLGYWHTAEEDNPLHTDAEDHDSLRKPILSDWTMQYKQEPLCRHEASEYPAENLQRRAWMRCTTARLSWRPTLRSRALPRSQGCCSAAFALGRAPGSLASSCATKSRASALMPSQQLRLKSRLSPRIDCLRGVQNLSPFSP